MLRLDCKVDLDNINSENLAVQGQYVAVQIEISATFAYLLHVMNLVTPAWFSLLNWLLPFTFYEFIFLPLAC